MKSVFVLMGAALASGAIATEAPAIPASSGLYRLPFADGTEVSVFDAAASHRPVGAVDLVGEPREGKLHRIVAAADGTVMAIQDGYSEQQSGRAASECRNNLLWLAHPNGEWTLYGHMATGSTSGKAGLKVGDHVRAGQYVGDEAAVAMLDHVHFEVAVPQASDPIDKGGFLNGNEERQRMRVPRFCNVPGQTVRKDAHYTALACGSASE
ncbi:MAG TPA: M23 family metallopeptidase [Sphingopyxis sp.]|uniref:M23 family metallopeptidase n=1 Tax=Sphingopyxis sp. TaxID=1908224 RepID=UPI002E2FD872|nr:M23 family metallopeptidase [Sphingopyxis sp.]HEX2814124.1 M23 family metallopeptidase [Sphingopyxis sp.]